MFIKYNKTSKYLFSYTLKNITNRLRLTICCIFSEIMNYSDKLYKNWHEFPYFIRFRKDIEGINNDNDNDNDNDNSLSDFHILKDYWFPCKKRTKVEHIKQIIKNVREIKKSYKF